MHWETAYATREEFAVGESPSEAKRLFEGRLAAARKREGKKVSRATEEERLFRADRLVHPVPQTNHRGEPHWDGSAAQKTLKQDVANGVHIGMMPQQYYAFRLPVFKDFSPKTIAGHVIQEERLIKFLKQRRNNV